MPCCRQGATVSAGEAIRLCQPLVEEPGGLGGEGPPTGGPGDPPVLD
jgi:hypothetical protein